MENRFTKAAKQLQTLASELEPDLLLKFYALYKQATVGPCDTPKPNWYQMQAKYKWEAWKNLGNMPREAAMQHYINALTEINPSWEENSKTETQSWVTVSRITNSETELQDGEKTFLDWVKEGNNNKVQEILFQNSMLVNISDEEGLLPIHWAADRGHVAVLDSLIKQGANVNLQDNDGQTPLHYAASCGHFETVQFLLSVGAQPCIKDNDGLKPKDVADKQLAAIL